MNYLKPVFVTSQEEVPKQPNKNFYVYPLEYHVKDSTKMFLFDFPNNIKIFIHGIFIPSESFDYFNPLITSPSHIKLYDTNEKTYIDSCLCKRIYSNTLNNQIDFYLKETFYYPLGYTIYYMNYRVVNSSYNDKFIQICDRILGNCLPSPQINGRLLGGIPINGPTQFIVPPAFSSPFSSNLSTSPESIGNINNMQFFAFSPASVPAPSLGSLPMPFDEQQRQRNQEDHDNDDDEDDENDDEDNDGENDDTSSDDVDVDDDFDDDDE